MKTMLDELMTMMNQLEGMKFKSGAIDDTRGLEYALDNVVEHLRYTLKRKWGLEVRAVTRWELTDPFMHETDEDFESEDDYLI